MVVYPIDLLSTARSQVPRRVREATRMSGAMRAIEMHERAREWMAKQSLSAASLLSVGSAAGSSDSGSQSQNSYSRSNRRTSVSQVYEELENRDRRISYVKFRLMSKLQGSHDLTAIDVDGTLMRSSDEEDGAKLQPVAVIPDAAEERLEVTVSKALIRRNSMRDVLSASYGRTNLKQEPPEESSSKMSKGISETNPYLAKTYVLLGTTKGSADGLPEEYSVPESARMMQNSNGSSHNLPELRFDSGPNVLLDDCWRLSEACLGGAVRAIQHSFTH
eukprot:763780-Hanusia_phi.AAC.2